MKPIIGASEETTLFKPNWKSDNHAAKVNCSQLLILSRPLALVIAAAADAAAAAVPRLAVRPRHRDRCDQRCESSVRRRDRRDLLPCLP